MIGPKIEIVSKSGELQIFGHDPDVMGKKEWWCVSDKWLLTPDELFSGRVWERESSGM